MPSKDEELQQFWIKGHFSSVCKVKKVNATAVSEERETFNCTSVKQVKGSPKKSKGGQKLPCPDKRDARFSFPDGTQKSFKMDLDLATPCIIIPNQIWLEYFSAVPILKTKYSFQGVGKDGNLHCQGYIMIKLVVNGKSGDTEVYVCETNDLLFGRNGMKKFKLVPDLDKI